MKEQEGFVHREKEIILETVQRLVWKVGRSATGSWVVQVGVWGGEQGPPSPGPCCERAASPGGV